MFEDNIFFPNDQVFGLWMFLLAVLPGVPYSLYYVILRPWRVVYWFQFFGSLLVILASVWFIRSGYERTDETQVLSGKRQLPSQVCLRLVTLVLGPNSSLRRHLATDWLAACWLFFFANLSSMIGSYAFLFSAANDRQVYVWTTSFFDSLLFLLGAAYFVAGSYPRRGTALRVHRGVYRMSGRTGRGVDRGLVADREREGDGDRGDRNRDRDPSSSSSPRPSQFNPLHSPSPYLPLDMVLSDEEALQKSIDSSLTFHQL